MLVVIEREVGTGRDQREEFIWTERLQVLRGIRGRINDLFKHCVTALCSWFPLAIEVLDNGSVVSQGMKHRIRKRRGSDHCTRQTIGVHSGDRLLRSTTVLELVASYHSSSLVQHRRSVCISAAINHLVSESVQLPMMSRMHYGFVRSEPLSFEATLRWRADVRTCASVISQ